jgi:putative membrane protein
MAFLIGVMLGSLKVPAVVVASSVSLNFSGLLPCLIVAIIAFALIIILETRFDYIE